MRVAVLCFSMALCVAAGRGQSASGAASKSDQNDLDGLVKTLSNYSDDLQAMMKSVSGAELDELATIQENAASDSNMLYLATRELRILDSVNCSTDRVKVARMIADDLGFYIFHFNSQATRFTSLLPILKSPAIAETGIKLRDTLRTAKDKLEAIKTTLR